MGKEKVWGEKGKLSCCLTKVTWGLGSWNTSITTEFGNGYLEAQNADKNSAAPIQKNQNVSFSETEFHVVRANFTCFIIIIQMVVHFSKRCK